MAKTYKIGKTPKTLSFNVHKSKYTKEQISKALKETQKTSDKKMWEKHPEASKIADAFITGLKKLSDKKKKLKVKKDGSNQ